MKDTSHFSNVYRRLIFLFALMLILGDTMISAQSGSQLFERYISAQQNRSSDQASQILNEFADIESNNFENLIIEAREAFRNGSVYYGFLYYEKALRLEPNNLNIRLEYAQRLYQNGLFEYCEHQINIYQERGGGSIEAKEMLGNLLLWQADYTQAKDVFTQILEQIPGNVLARNGLQEIESITSPYLKANYQFFSDDQPLVAHEILSAYDQYANAYWSPFARINFRTGSSEDSLMESNTSLLHMEAGNSIHWHKEKLRFDFKGGYYTQQQAVGNFTYGVQLTKKFPLDLNLYLNLERSPYLSTISSLTENVYLDEYSIKLKRPYDRFLNGECAWTYRRFMDGNTGQNLYAYLMANVFTNNQWLVKAGYSLNYEDMDESRFTSVISIEEVINRGEYENIPGLYIPYFTPEEQLSHSLLLNVSWQASTGWKLFSNVSWGVYAKSRIPFLFLSETETGEKVIDRGFKQIDQQVREISIGVNFALYKTLSGTILGRYEKLFFYERMGLQAGLNWQL